MHFSFCGGRVFKAAVSVFACVFTLSVLGQARVDAITLSEEKDLGQKFLGMIRKRMPMVEDGDVLTYVRSVGNRVAKEVGTTSYQYQFFIIDQPVPNAFAVPGGYIFVYRGIIEMMSSEGELASILSHELAHIQARHIQRQIDESKVLTVTSVAGLIAGILLGASAAGPALAAGSMAASQTAALQYSRAHEMEADQLGFRFLCSAGYDPSDMASIMHKMDQRKWSGVSRVPDYLMTHPALGERVLYLDDMAQKQKATKPVKIRTTVGDFQLMQAALIAGYTDQDKAFERFQSGAKKGDKAAIYGLGCLYMREGRYKDAEAQLQIAARAMPSSPLVLSGLGAAYHQVGKLQEAQKTFQTALTLDPSASIVHYRLALVLMDLGQKEEALEHLQQIEELAPMFPEVDYQLGVVLGQVNRLGLAHYHLGRYYANKQNIPLAVMHYKKAKSYIMDSPAKMDEINQALKELEPSKKGGLGKR